jgi:protein involved in sex pheromone biosynthesis
MFIDITGNGRFISCSNIMEIDASYSSAHVYIYFRDQYGDREEYTRYFSTEDEKNKFIKSLNPMLSKMELLFK